MRSREFYMKLGEAIYRIDGAYDGFAKDSRVSPKMLWLLCALSDGKENSQCQISRDWHFPCTTVNTLVKELEGKGYVEMSPIPGCRREMRIGLTETGRAFAEEIVAPVWEAEDRLFGRFFADRSTDFIEELHAFADAMETSFGNIGDCGRADSGSRMNSPS